MLLTLSARFKNSTAIPNEKGYDQVLTHGFKFLFIFTFRLFWDCRVLWVSESASTELIFWNPCGLSGPFLDPGTMGPDINAPRHRSLF